MIRHVTLQQPNLLLPPQNKAAIESRFPELILNMAVEHSAPNGRNGRVGRPSEVCFTANSFPCCFPYRRRMKSANAAQLALFPKGPPCSRGPRVLSPGVNRPMPRGAGVRGRRGPLVPVLRERGESHGATVLSGPACVLRAFMHISVRLIIQHGKLMVLLKIPQCR